jgi:hypothetical protein
LASTILFSVIGFLGEVSLALSTDIIFPYRHILLSDRRTRLFARASRPNVAPGALQLNRHRREELSYTRFALPISASISKRSLARISWTTSSHYLEARCPREVVASIRYLQVADEIPLYLPSV